MQLRPTRRCSGRAKSGAPLNSKSLGDTANWVTSEQLVAATNWIQIADGLRSLRFEFASRDWKVLMGPHVPEGAAWLTAFGFNGPPGTSVARGLEVGYEVEGERDAMLGASSALLVRVEADAVKLEHDYWVIIAPDPFRGRPELRVGGGGISGLRFGGESFALWVPAGHCYLDPPPASHRPVVDLRGIRNFDLDPPTKLVVHKRRRGLAWRSVLPKVISFLSETSSAKVSTFNHHQ